MGKRSNFERRPRDFYSTPLAAVEPLIPHLPYTFTYIEPCAGDNRLVNHVQELTGGHGDCILASDIEPQSPEVLQADAFNIDVSDLGMDYIITNPPWEREFLHRFIDKYLDIAPTWLLFDADWMHTKQSSILMSYCVKVVSVGRVKWIEGSKMTGKDNCCWYLFDGNPLRDAPTEFYGRVAEGD